MTAISLLRARRTQWRPSHRLVPSRFPPVGLFDRVARPEDLEAVFELEAMTNDRVRDEAGQVTLVSPQERTGEHLLADPRPVLAKIQAAQEIQPLPFPRAVS